MTTGAQIRAALSSVGGLGGQAWTLDTIAAGADDAMRAAGITTRQGAACLVAQCMVESAYFRTTTEYSYKRGTAGWHNMQRYAPYIGRGFIQLTWRDNYAKFGVWCKARGLVSDANTFVSQPTRLAEPRWAWLGAVFYFTTHRHGLVALANAGENIKVGRAINRGDAHSSYAAYGEDHRQQAYRALLNAGIQAPTGAPSVGSTAAVVLPGVKYSIKQVQELVGVTVDGVAGPATVAAIKEIQSALDLTADGVVGKSTEAAMASIIDKIDALAKDVKEIKTEQKKTAQRVWAHQIDTPKSVLGAFPWFNKKFTAGGAQMYNLFSFGAKDDTDRIIKAIKDDQ